MSFRSHFVFRVPGTIVYPAILMLMLFAAAEIGQRVSDWRKWNKRLSRPFSTAVETADGSAYGNDRGTLLMRHAPYLLFSAKPNQDAFDIHVNAQGFRGEDWPQQKEPGTFRIAVLGGSAAFGHAVPDDEDVFSRILERRLREEHPAPAPRAEVLNAGVWAYNSTQELILLTTRVLDYEPDAIVLFDGYNDWAAARSSRAGVYGVSPIFYEIDRQLQRASKPWRNALRTSAAFRGLERKGPGWMWTLRRKLTQWTGGQSEADREETRRLAAGALQYYARNLERMIRFASTSGAVSVVAPQPEVFTRRGAVPPNEEKTRRKKGSDLAEFARQEYPKYVAAARSVAMAEGALFVDTSSVCDHREESCFVDAVHLTRDGNVRVAEELLAPVSELLLAAGRPVED